MRFLVKLRPLISLIKNHINTETHIIPTFSIAAKLNDYSQLMKMRLTVIVVFSAVVGYLLGMEQFHLSSFVSLIIGGLLVTGASNGFNQVIEREPDRLMKRTANRPLPAGRMSVAEALIFSVFTGVTGVVLLWRFAHPNCAWLSALSMLSYVAVYTPLKRVTPFSVAVGAFPGAVPPMLGWLAATGQFGLGPGLLFGMQFMWQFPHFWAIAWKLDEDYKRAGFRMLPSKGGRNQSSAFLIMVYSIFMVAASLLPVAFGIISYYSAIAILACGVWACIKAYGLYKTCGDVEASKLLIVLLAFLPVVLILYLLDKMIIQ